MKQSQKVILAMLIITVFILIVAGSSLYVQYHIETGEVCGCAIPLYLFVPFLSSLGLFIGVLVYYLLFVKVETKSDFIKENLDAIISLLPPNERAVFKLLVKEPLPQSRIMKLTGFDKVKTFRIVKKLEQRGLVTREKYGKTYIVKLSDRMKELFE